MLETESGEHYIKTAMITYPNSAITLTYTNHLTFAYKTDERITHAGAFPSIMMNREKCKRPVH